MSKIRIRKALESQLLTAMEAAGIECVTGKGHLDTAGLSEYVRGSVSFGEDHATEVGRNPRIERAGRLNVGVFTEVVRLEDRNDVVCGLVRAAFPYGLDLEREGIQVNILTVDDGDCVGQGSFLFSPVTVKFMVWSAT